MNGQPIETLEQLGALVRQLKLAAERRDGENLPGLVDQYIELSARVFETPAGIGTGSETLRWKALANEVLELQREIETLTSPWMSDLRILLRENRKEQALSNTYRTEP